MIKTAYQPSAQMLGSSAWKELKDHFESRLDDLRKDNDKDQDAEKTAFIRGQISEIKRLLAYDKPKPPLELVHDEQY